MRASVTIIEKTPGEGDWEVAVPPSNDPGAQREFIKALPTGDQRAIVFESSGPGKRRRVTWSAAEAPKRRGRPPKSAIS